MIDRALKYILCYYAQSEYIRKMGLAGGMVWALDLDDFKNRCGEGPHPLMNEIKKVLGPSKGSMAMDRDVGAPTMEQDAEEHTVVTPWMNGHTNEEKEYKVVCCKKCFVYI